MQPSVPPEASREPVDHHSRHQPTDISPLQVGAQLEGAVGDSSGVGHIFQQTFDLGFSEGSVHLVTFTQHRDDLTMLYMRRPVY